MPKMLLLYVCGHSEDQIVLTVVDDDPKQRLHIKLGKCPRYISPYTVCKSICFKLATDIQTATKMIRGQQKSFV